jgi:hypothetical protein
MDVRTFVDMPQIVAVDDGRGRCRSKTDDACAG